MYKVEIKSRGKYGNWELGERYILGKRNAEKVIKLALDDNCEIVVERLICCGLGIFCWSDDHDLYSGDWYEEEEE